MDRIKFEKCYQIWLCVIFVLGCLLIGIGVGMLLQQSICPISLISLGVGIICSVIFLVRNKYYEIENQRESNT